LSFLRQGKHASTSAPVSAALRQIGVLRDSTAAIILPIAFVVTH